MSSVQSFPIVFTKYFRQRETKPREKNEGKFSDQSGDAM